MGLHKGVFVKQLSSNFSLFELFSQIFLIVPNLNLIVSIELVKYFEKGVVLIRQMDVK